jgi:membrane-bound serine protease (ClpP class)
MLSAAALVALEGATLPSRIVEAITDPNIAYLLLVIGFMGLFAELFHPGAVLPGVAGAIALILAFVALTSLPVNWVGFVLLLLSMGLIGADLARSGRGRLLVAGLLVFLLGSFFLYSPAAPGAPRPHVNPSLIVVVVACMTAIVLLIRRALRHARHTPVASGAAALVGRTGVAESALAPRGTVRVDSEVWSAQIIAGEAPIATGEAVEVVALEGVTLRVRRQLPERQAQRREA